MDDVKINRVLWIVSAYGLVVTALYLFGYWGRFGLNVLEYIGIGDIVGHALMPFLASIAFIALGFAISTIIHGGQFPPGGGADTINRRFSRTYRRLLTVLTFGAICFVAVVGPEPVGWFIVAFLMVPLPRN